MPGFTFLEILVSLFILSLLLLGLDAMHLVSLREARVVYYSSVAMNQVVNMVERLTVTKNNSLANELYVWNQQNQVVLPNGRGVVSGVYPHFKVAIFWGDESQRACESDKIEESGCLHLAL